MRRLLLLAVVICAVFAVGQGPHSVGPVPAAAQATERTEFRKAAPSCAQAVKELHLEGQPVNCQEPPPPTYDPPQMHGPYRLIAPTYVGPLTYQDEPAPSLPKGVVSEDPQVVQRSPLYRPPAWMPQGYVLDTLKTGDAGSDEAVIASYKGPGQPVSITSVRRYTQPVDVTLPGPESVLTFEALTVDGKPGILWYPKPEASVAAHLTTSLSYMEGDVEITVMGEELHAETAKGIALSIACGVGCVPPELRVPQVAGTPQPQSPGGAAASADSAPGAPTFPPPGELRILQGLGTLSDYVKVTYHGPPENSYWHGFLDGPDYNYNEAALDITDPGGNTAGTNVYYLAWLYSPGASITATTDSYPSAHNCTGKTVKLTETADPSHVLGTLTYVHIVGGPGPGDTWSNGSMWTIHYLGTAAATQDPPCYPEHFSAPHLHQGQSLLPPSSVWIAHNEALPTQEPVGAVIDPTNDYENNWMFRVALVDSDGDGCTDSQETGMGFDPHNQWDFYDVPVPSLRSGPGGTRNRAVTIGDVLAVNTYSGVRAGDAAYEADVNGNGVIDGWEYDRSPSPPPNPPYDAGPPNGFIGMSDVLAVNAQSGLNCIP